MNIIFVRSSDNFVMQNIYGNQVLFNYENSSEPSLTENELIINDFHERTNDFDWGFVGEDTGGDVNWCLNTGAVMDSDGIVELPKNFK